MPEPADAWVGAAAIDTPAIDHLGLVVADVEPVVHCLRQNGFAVSDPEALQGESGPLGQVSAHCVFANAYLEISAPTPGSGNHLEALLARGPGWRLLLFRAGDDAPERASLDAAGVASGPLREASRAVRLPGGARTARFRWFELPDLLPGVLAGFVEHRDPDIVFAPALSRHPNGATRLEAVLFGAGSEPIAALPGAPGAASPRALFNPAAPQAISGLAIGGCAPLRIDAHGLSLRAGP
jgi:hypothetical protein